MMGTGGIRTERKRMHGLPPYILFIALFSTLCFNFLYKVRSSIVLLLELVVFALFRPLLIILNGKNQTKDNILFDIELSFLLRKIDTCSLSYSLFDCKLFIAYHFACSYTDKGFSMKFNWTIPS